MERIHKREVSNSTPRIFIHNVYNRWRLAEQEDEGKNEWGGMGADGPSAGNQAGRPAPQG